MIQAGDYCCRGTDLDPTKPGTAAPPTPEPVVTERHEPPRGEFEPRTVPILQTAVGQSGRLSGEIERTAILRALESTRYNKTAAAEKLGISFRRYATG